MSIVKVLVAIDKRDYNFYIRQPIGTLQVALSRGIVITDDIISRSALQISHKDHCCGECACCVHCKEGFSCELIDNAPAIGDNNG